MDPYSKVLITRRENLRRLVKLRYRCDADLADALMITRSYLSQLIGKRASRPITEKTARMFELRLFLKTGWLDRGVPNEHK